MSQFRLPTDLTVSVDDFHASGWNEALQGVMDGDISYSSLWTALSKTARSAMEDSRFAHAKVLWLLADASSMILSPERTSDPFKPFAIFHDRRSAQPEDFSHEDLLFFSQIVELIDDALLKARLADLLWFTVRKPPQFEYALTAIDAYRRVPLTPDSWIRDSRECWARAFVLAQALKTGAGNRIEDMQKQVLDTLMSTSTRENFFGAQIARLLRENRLAKSHGLDVAQKLEALAREFDKARNIFGARAYFEEAASWFDWVRNQDKYAEMTAAQAETYAREAAFHAAASGPSNMVANSLYEKAIQIYRVVPGKFRAASRADERIKELRRLQSSAGEQALSEMSVIRSPAINITELVEQARKDVRGKEPIEALKSLADIHPGESADTLRDNVIERMKEFPLQWIFENTTYSRDGRVIARRPAMNLLGTALSKSDERAIQSAMVSEYGMFLGLTVQSAILPALEVLRQEHRLREADFIELSQHSSIVPVGRARLFGKALHAGYDGDFVFALHLLAPQIEHMVRTHLKQAGSTTTTLDKEGIENENGLSTLMALPETAVVFGKDLAFELQALFCDASGPNLRNQLAHGLLDDDDCRSPPSIYAWWLALKLVFNTWWNTQAAQQSES